MAGALGNSGLNRKREQHLDMKVNIYRAIIAGVNLWFTIKKSWTPPLKWWERHVKRLGIDDETFGLFKEALETPSVESVYHLFQRLKTMILEEGYEFPNDPVTAFLETIHTTGRPAQIRHSYL